MIHINRLSWYGCALLVVSIAAAGTSAFGQKIPGSQRNADRGLERPEHEQNDNRAFPEAEIAPAQQEAAYKAFLSLSSRRAGKEQEWKEIGPTDPFVVGPATYTGRPTYDSGRVTSLALSPDCRPGHCGVFVGAAGGGVWTSPNVFGSDLQWRFSGEGIPSNAIGSIIFDPTDRVGRTLYVGTGEPNGSGDSEAGVGLYISRDFGQSWRLVPGSASVSRGRSIAAIAVDPIDPNHIFIGTAVARHGSSSANGGRFTPPGVPQIGLYESHDGGATFSLAFSRKSDIVDPNSPNGSDFFRGGVSNVVFNRTGLSERAASRVYISVFDYGVFRSNGSGGYEQIFASAGGGLVENSAPSRTEFALAPKGDALRIYVGDAGGGPADFYRVDNALVAAATLTDGTNNPGWIKLSNSAPGTPGFASYDYCSTQCSYDMPVGSPPGEPDTVWIGGSMQYTELFGPSNGRAVQRSTDAGVSFTDMTNDMQSPPLGMHPDQHAIAFVPGHPGIAIIGSDGGVYRTNGEFANASSTCDNRGLFEPQLSQCHQWLSNIPTRLFTLNKGLATLQFQSLSLNSKDPLNDIMGGTQDNGTWATARGNNQAEGNHSGEEELNWFESVGGDGGQSGVDSVNPNIRFHNYFDALPDINFQATAPLAWDLIGGPLFNSNDARSFYIPMIPDPKVGGTLFAGLAHVWRTTDDGGPRAFLDLRCNEFTGDLALTADPACGDFVTLGANLVTGPSSDKGGSYVVALQRTPSDTSTLWVGTRRGRLFLSKNADASPGSVTFLRLDTPSQPRRFISGISVDPRNPNHAWTSFSGYNAYTLTTPGHVFEVTVHEGLPTWKDLSYNLGDQPITGIARDDLTGDLYVATDFGVAMLPSGSTAWIPAGTGFPFVAVYGLTIDSEARVLYAATHGRGAWKLKLDSSD